MAKLVQFSLSDGSTMALPSVTHHVSAEVNNRLREDVILVQAMFQIIVDRSRFMKSPLKHPVRVTGFFGPDTDKLVRKFEKEIMKRGKPTGIVSPAHPTAFARASGIWTIIQLAFLAGESIPPGFAGNSNAPLLRELRKFPELAGPLDPSKVQVP
jgi:hypothetical protein